MDSDASSVKLSELLRHPDDLDRIIGLKSEFTRKKAAVDAQLKLGLKEQLQLTQSGMSSIKVGQQTLNTIKEEMMKIDRLCAEAQSMIHNFPEINAVAQAHRNFTQVETTKQNIESFATRLDRVNALLEEDEDDLDSQPNLLPIHHEISQLRTIRDEALQQAKNDPSLEADLQRVFGSLESTVDTFDEHVGHGCIQLIPLVNADNTSLVVRLAIVIEEEEKFDERAKELQDAQREFKDLAARFKSLAVGTTELRGYKAKFLEAIHAYAQAQLTGSDQAFLEDPEKLDKSLRWYFNDLFAVKAGMVQLMPKKWKIFKTYVGIYHKLLYEWLSAKAADKEVQPVHMLAIIHWKDKYYDKMRRLEGKPDDLNPTLPGGRDSDLVREYRQLIVNKVDEWMSNLNRTDRADFIARKETSIDTDEHGRFRTKTLADMWRLLHEQLLVAGDSQLLEVVEGVTDAMFRALKTRVDMWFTLINNEVEKYTKPNVEPEAIQSLQDWLCSLANDQIVSISYGEANHVQPGYLHQFHSDFAALVSHEYANQAESKVETLQHTITDLGFRCIHVFVRIIFLIDFKTVLPEFFTPNWYHRSPMGQLISTFEDYRQDYKEVMHHLLSDLFIEEVSQQLLIAYLSAVHNRNIKVSRLDAFESQVKDDVQTAFKFFENFEAFQTVEGVPGIKDKWRVVSAMLSLIQCDKHVIQATFRDFLQDYWDVKLTWVEALLRMRQDIDWGPLGEGKSIMKGLRQEAAELRVEHNVGTVMAEVE